MSHQLTVATLQPALVMLDAAVNRQKIEEQVAGIVGERAIDVLVLPEIFTGWPAAREDIDAAASRAFVSYLALQFRTRVVGGSMGWTDGATRSNVCFIADQSGREVGQYAKRMPFGHEQGTVSPGQAEGVVEVDGIRLGVLICGDLWWPQLARELIGRIDVLCVPARTGVTTETHVEYARMLWRNLALTRAMENGMPVIVSDWAAGRHEIDGKAHWTSGGSSMVDPSARPDVLRLQRKLDGAGSIVAAIDLEAVAAFRDYRKSVGLIPTE